MSRPAAGTAPAAKGLTQQQADFTAEGAPPSGKVGLSAPESSSGSVDAKQRALDQARAVAKAVIELRAGRLQGVQPKLTRPPPK